MLLKLYVLVDPPPPSTVATSEMSHGTAKNERTGRCCHDIWPLYSAFKADRRLVQVVTKLYEFLSRTEWRLGFPLWLHFSSSFRISLARWWRLFVDFNHRSHLEGNYYSIKGFKQVTRNCVVTYRIMIESRRRIFLNIYLSISWLPGIYQECLIQKLPLQSQWYTSLRPCFPNERPSNPLQRYSGQVASWYLSYRWQMQVRAIQLRWLLRSLK